MVPSLSSASITYVSVPKEFESSNKDIENGLNALLAGRPEASIDRLN